MPLYIVVLWVKHIQNGREKVPPSFVRALLFGTTWAILGAIWGPAGRQGAPKIDSFGTKSHQKLKKWIPERGIKKSKFDEKMKILNVLKPQNYYV